MSNKRGIRSYYLIMEKLEQELLASPFVKTVTYGDISQVDLRKQTIFPLSHIIVNNSTKRTSNDIQYNYSFNGYNRCQQSCSSRSIYWEYR